MGKGIVIYGGSGGIGSATARLLQEAGHEPHLVGRSEDKLSALSSELQTKYTRGDVCDDSLFFSQIQVVRAADLRSFDTY